MTFLVNDILKHQVVLLGNAEEKKKKKVICFSHSICENYLVSLEVAYIILLN